ncbi:MAG: hypothetical protein ACI4S9_02415 [Christensenellales bacterium]
MKLIKFATKIFASGMLAFVFLNLFCLLYYNVPVHSDNPDGATDYHWEKGKFYLRGTEGFACGRTNDDGFNNIDNLADLERIDILLMGSSHMEAFQVSQNQSTAAILNQSFGEEKYTYNIGTSGHTFYTSVANLENALETYKPTGYVLIETLMVSFSQKALRNVIDGTLQKQQSNDGGVVGFLQRIPYLRLLYLQVNNMKEKNVVSVPEETVGEDDVSASDDPELWANLDTVLKKVSSLCLSYGVQPIIFYHTQISVESSGKPYTTTDRDDLNRVSALCNDNGIIFIDVTQSFIEEYNVSFRLPYGFVNTSAGKGHLNSVGHSIIGKKIYSVIVENEGK